MSGKNKLAKIQDDSLGSNANRQTRPNMVDASLLSDYIATLKNLLNFKDEQIRELNEQIREQQEQMRLLIDKFRKLFEQCNESTGRNKGKHLLS